jgi:hypothetical protein
MASERPRRRRVWFAAVAVGASVSLTLGVFLMLDLYLHAKYERTASVNRWGYRGPVVGGKRADEYRVVVLGGSTAFGYGPDWDGSFPYLLERKLNETAGRQWRYSVVNLAYNNEGAYAFRYTLEDYFYLRYDLAILYEGYNDLGDRPNLRVLRRDSGLFRTTGYLPIFPLILREKAAVMLYGQVGRAYSGATVFRADVAGRATAGALEVAAATAESLERQLGHLTRDWRSAEAVIPETGCGDRWRQYCGAVDDAIRWARARQVGVLVGTQPFISDRHVEQQAALAAMLRDRFRDDPGVAHVQLGAAVDLRDASLAYDGMHLNTQGNAIIAQGFVEPVLRMASTLRRH